MIVQNLKQLELIDTLWNVNMIGTLSPDMGHTELIDTLWNVNEF